MVERNVCAHKARAMDCTLTILDDCYYIDNLFRSLLCGPLPEHNQISANRRLCKHKVHVVL